MASELASSMCFPAAERSLVFSFLRPSLLSGKTRVVPVEFKISRVLV